ncbi:DUF4113 domain-containing protein [Agrobacterium sp. fls2-241-TYG-188a]|uniref:DUF4113 domain-containing protein n=1 Tax=Agrobacterium sp. fls2-241-TYG-188a TaxID=3040275 RepID=UPI00254D8C2D|nr:DUF4113 domain-containing protein [Agrobacterium sp. fls2-241-TYG-188a]
MRAIYAINGSFGRGTLIPAAAGIKKEWQAKFERRSHRYTACIKELPTVSSSITCVVV